MNRVPRLVWESLGVYLAAVPTLLGAMRSWQDGWRRPLTVDGVLLGVALTVTVAWVLVAALVVRRVLAQRGGGQPRPPAPSGPPRPVTVARCRGRGQRQLLARRVGFDLGDCDQDRPPQRRSTSSPDERRWL